MPDDNVHRLSDRRLDGWNERASPYREPEQLELFDNTYGAMRAISYLDIAVLDQERFIRSLIMNAVTTIIDLRGVPVFPKPRFDHRFLMSYFYERSVDYIEFAMIKNAPRERVCADETLNRWFASAPSPGITACIIDNAAIRDGAVACFRQTMAKSTNGYVEIHPRAFF